MKHFQTLVSVAQVADLIAQPHVAILDCRFDLARPLWGATDYAEAHVPGAQYAHLERDLSGAVTPATGRHPLPDPQLLAQRLGELGVGNDAQVIVYDQGNGMYAARAWWLLRWLGHPRVALLDGGWSAWRQAGLAVEQQVSRPTQRSFVARVAVGAVATAAEVEAARGLERELVVDARSAERYAGLNETIDPVAGHVPGAANHPFTRNLAADGNFLPREALRAAWLTTLGATSPARTIAMCGSGVSACHNLLALEHAGLLGARLYAGSWSEWIRDPTRPVATSS
ncbi:MAG TPA: sulfurtransferase [Steroidobacteraceae bacterium]|nr:sulfurtransferase [Steroidobacteraceae bacterium]HRX90231.1 sulfurtransferase [Steroidobacteraceae bacterium]